MKEKAVNERASGGEEPLKALFQLDTFQNLQKYRRLNESVDCILRIFALFYI